MRHLEDNLQQTCVQWFLLQYPDRIIFHIPNAGRRGGRLGLLDGVRFKKLGLKAGVPDLFISEPIHPFHGFYIEMKAPKERPSKEQNEMLTRLGLRGYKTTWCNSFDDFKLKVENYFNNRK